MRVTTIILLAATHLAFGSDAQWDDRFSTNSNDSSYALAIYRGEVYTSYFRYNGQRLARWRLGGHFADILSSGPDLFVCGNASSFGGMAQRGVARWDGTNWHHVGTGLPASDFGLWVAALAFRREELYAGGQLEVGGGAWRGIARFDGTNWVEPGGGVTIEGLFGGYVYAMTAKNGILYVAGLFDEAGGVPAGSVAAWDGTNWSALGSGLAHRTVSALAFHRGNLFALAGGLYKWDTTNWTLIAPIGGRVMTSAGDDLYIGGRFDAVNDVSATNVVRWDGTNWWPLGTGISGNPDDGAGVHDMVLWRNELVVTGIFDTAGGKPSRNFAVWHLPAVDIKTNTDQIDLSWWKGFTNYALEASDTLPASHWTPVATQPNTNYHSAPASGPKKLFRLRQK